MPVSMHRCCRQQPVCTVLFKRLGSAAGPTSCDFLSQPTLPQPAVCFPNPKTPSTPALSAVFPSRALLPSTAFPRCRSAADGVSALPVCCCCNFPASFYSYANHIERIQHKMQATGEAEQLQGGFKRQRTQERQNKAWASIVECMAFACGVGSLQVALHAAAGQRARRHCKTLRRPAAVDAVREPRLSVACCTKPGAWEPQGLVKTFELPLPAVAVSCCSS